MKNTRLSVKFPGRGWAFAKPTNKVREELGISYYRIGFEFCVVERTVRIPSSRTKYSQVGSGGDYLARDIFGNLTVMKKKIYDTLYPSQSYTPPPKSPLSSEALKDPNFLTKIAEGAATLEYNRTQRSASTRRTSRY